MDPDSERAYAERAGSGEILIRSGDSPVKLLTKAARTIGDHVSLWVRFPDGSRCKARPILGDWMGGTEQRPWPDVEFVPEEDGEKLPNFLKALREMGDRVERERDAERSAPHRKSTSETIAMKARQTARDRIVGQIDAAINDVDGAKVGDAAQTIFDRVFAPLVAERDELAAECKAADDRAAEALIRAERAEAGNARPGTRELHVVIADNHNPGDPQPFFVEIEDQDGRGVGGFERRQGAPGLTHIVIPYGRDDEWAQGLAMAAIVAGQECDVPFPADVLDGVLRDFNVRPNVPRTWPHRGERAEPAFCLTEELMAGRGWKGTPPAEGTRRALIRDTLRDAMGDHPRAFDAATLDQRALKLADAVESALLQTTIDEEARERGAEALMEGIEKVSPVYSVRVVIAGAPHRVACRLEDRIGELIESAFEVAGIPNEHPGEWTLRIGDGTELLPDATVGGSGLGTGATVYLDPDAGGGAAVKQPEPDSCDEERGLTEYEEKLLHQREEARAGESRLMEQRNAALSLLRWLIGDLIPPYPGYEEDGD